MGKRRKNLSLDPNPEIDLKLYQKVLLGVVWVAAVIVVMVKTVQNDQGTWMTGLLGLGGMWLIISVIFTVVGLIEMLLQKLLGLPISRYRSITFGKGVKGIIDFCLGAVYMITVMMAIIMLFVKPLH